MSRKTRKAKADELLELALRGPSFNLFFASDGVGVPSATIAKANKDATDTFRRWSNSWMVPLLKELVPELRISAELESALERIARQAVAK